MKTIRASGQIARTFFAPFNSISRITSSPASNDSCTAPDGVPYMLPAYSAHSKKRPSPIQIRKTSSLRNK